MSANRLSHDGSERETPNTRKEVTGDPRSPQPHTPECDIKSGSPRSMKP